MKTKSIDRVAFSQRLREHAMRKHGSVSAFAKNVWNMNPAGCTQYMNGKSLPGSEMILKLYEDGCDFYYLCTGEQSQALSQKIELENEDYRARLRDIATIVHQLKLELSKLEIGLYKSVYAVKYAPKLSIEEKNAGTTVSAA